MTDALEKIARECAEALARHADVWAQWPEPERIEAWTMALIEKFEPLCSDKGHDSARTFWTIEYFRNGKSEGYWDGGHCESKTTDISKAIQFHRREDAMWTSMGWHVPRTITEHVLLPRDIADDATEKTS